MDIIDHLVVNMSEMELYDIKGGFSYLSSTMLNSIIRAFSFSLELGRMLGSYIRRRCNHGLCPIK